MRTLLVALTLLVTTPAGAQMETTDQPDPGQAAGVLERVQDPIAGTLRDVPEASREVEVVRAGTEFPGAPGVRLVSGDAVRTGRGRVLMRAPDGGTALLGPGSQVRFEADRWVHRLGRMDVDGSVLVIVQDLEIVVDGAVRIDRDIQGTGEVVVLRGEAIIARGSMRRSVPAATRALFDLSGRGADGPLEPEAMDTLLQERTLSTPNTSDQATSGLEPRAHLRIDGGLARIHDADFGRVGLSARVRISGPAFVTFGAAFSARAVDDIDVDAAFILPAHVGFRVVGPLPRGIFLLGGADFTAFVGEWCVGLGCVSDIAVDPGARGIFGVGLEIADRVALDLTVGAGVVRREIPARLSPEEPVVAELQLHFGFGLVFLLGG